jgi:hypothetical protein
MSKQRQNDSDQRSEHEESLYHNCTKKSVRQEQYGNKFAQTFKNIVGETWLFGKRNASTTLKQNAKASICGGGELGVSRNNKSVNVKIKR